MQHAFCKLRLAGLPPHSFAILCLVIFSLIVILQVMTSHVQTRSMVPRSLYSKAKWWGGAQNIVVHICMSPYPPYFVIITAQISLTWTSFMLTVVHSSTLSLAQSTLSLFNGAILVGKRKQLAVYTKFWMYIKLEGCKSPPSAATTNSKKWGTASFPHRLT